MKLIGIQHNARLFCWGVVLFLSGSSWVCGADLPLQSATPPNSPNRTGAGGSYAPQFSPDGRHLVFLSTANNLVTNDSVAPFLDVFLWNLYAQTYSPTTTLVSVNRLGLGGGNGHSSAPSIASNAQWIAFASAADDLVAADTNRAWDIFVRDVGRRETKLASLPWDGLGSAVGDPASDNVRLSRNPLISADGRWVFFESDATNLVDVPDTNRAPDLFVWDAHSQTNRLLTRNATGTSTANAGSELGAITTDGRWVVFSSEATDLVEGTTADGQPHIFLLDLQIDQINRVSSEAASWFADLARFVQPSISTGGQTVVFKAIEPNPNAVFLVSYDIASTQSSLVASNVAEHTPAWLSADGQRIAYEGDSQVWVWDAAGQTNILVSMNRTNTGPANQASQSPVMSRDGTKVAFLSSATDLVADDALGVSQVFLRHLDRGETELISLGENGQINRDSIEVMPPSLNPDGTLVAFESLDPGLVADDLNLAGDIFLRDWRARTTRVVSERHELRSSMAGMGYTKLSAQALSVDGRWLAFATLDNVWSVADTNRYQDLCLADLKNGTNLAILAPRPPGDHTNKVLSGPVVSASGRVVAYVQGMTDLRGVGSIDQDVLRLDLSSGTRTLVSALPGGGLSKASFGPVMSADGARIAFQSTAQANNFIPGIGTYFDASTNVYLNSFAPPQAGLRLISIDVTGTTTGSGSSMNPVFSPNGRWLIFQSLATNLTTNVVSPSFGQLFGCPLAAPTTRLLSIRQDGTGLTNHALNPAFSGNSHYLVFHSEPDYQGYRLDLWAHETSPILSEIVCSNCLALSASEDGGMIAFASPSQPGQPGQVYVKNLTNGLTRLASVNRTGTGPGNAASSAPLLSFNGRYVIFVSQASDLVNGPSPGKDDLFVRDLLQDSTFRVGQAWDGSGPANARCFDPVMSADGRTVVFRSFANNLVPGDYNLTADIFALRLSSGDSDGDAMEDDWEMAYFETLERDGAGDYDGDGYADVQEHGAGTDPTNAGSVFRVVTLSRAAGGPVTLVWSAIPGKTYLIEAILDVQSSDWRTLPGEVFATQTTASAVDQAGGTYPHQFYRVRLKE